MYEEVLFFCLITVIPVLMQLDFTPRCLKFLYLIFNLYRLYLGHAFDDKQYLPFQPISKTEVKRLSKIGSHFVAAFLFPVSCWWPIDPVHWPSGEEDPRPLQDATSLTTYCNYLILLRAHSQSVHCITHFQ